MRWFVLLALAACGSSSTPPVDPVGAVEAERFSADLTAIAAPRGSGSPHWQEVQDLCADRLAELGYDVERHAYGTGVNVIGVRTGTALPAERVMVSAHYDSTGVGCAGADDNATGVAGALEVARVLALESHARTLAVACWDEEEKGLIGSTAYVTRADAAGEMIVASYVFEMIGYRSSQPNSQTTDQNLAAVFPDQEAQIAANEYRGDFILLVHDEGAAATVADFVATATSIGLPTVALDVNNALKVAPGAAGLRRSDHAPFWFADYPAIMVTDTANFRNPHYHCGGGPDAISDIDIEFATANVKSVAGAVALALDR
jgi:Zn-dependent M28 family amino/carboxypeptidase